MRRVAFVVRCLIALVIVGVVASCAEGPTSPTKEGPSLATASNGSGLSITTDKDDYAPGDTVWFTGAGWTPGDSLDIVLTDSTDTHNWAVGIDENGGFRDSTYVVDTGDLGVTFTLTATSRSNPEQTLTVTFTDNIVSPSVTLDGLASVTVAANATISLAISASVKTTGGSPTSWRSTGWVLLLHSSPAPTGKLANCVDTPNWAGSSGNGTSAADTFNITAPSGSGTYDLYVALSDVDGTGATACGGVGGNAQTAAFQNKVVIPTPPTQLVFSTNLFSVGMGVCSPTITVQTRDGNNPADVVGSAVQVNLTSTSGGGTFYSNSGCTTGITFVTIAAGTHVGNFYYKDSSCGTPTIKAKDNNTGTGSLGEDTQTEAITGCPTNTAPTANPGGPYTTDEGSVKQLDGSGSLDLQDGTNITYLWSVDVTGNTFPYVAIDGGGVCKFYGTSDASDAATSTSTLQKPYIKCTDDGVFKLTLVVTDNGTPALSSTPAVTQLTVANVNPVANAGGPYSGNEGAGIQLSGSGTDAAANDVIASYSWSVDNSGIEDGGSCSLSATNIFNPVLTCNDNGTAKVSLTVTDDDGGTSTNVAQASIPVANVNPVANAGGPYSGNEGTAIPLSGSGTDAGANDVIASYSWSVDNSGIVDGGSCSLSSTTVANPTLTCNDNGTAKVSLTVTDDDGGTSTNVAEASIPVANVNPVANAGGPYSGNEGAAISLSGSGTDAGANDVIASYSWSVDNSNIVDGGSCSFSATNVANPTLTCNDNGSAKVSLTVTDDDGGTSTNVAEATVTVANVNPVITSLTLPLVPVPVNTPVSLSATFTDAGSNDTHTASINWEAGTNSGAVTESPGSGSVSGTYSFASAGIYTIVLTVYDDDSGSDTKTFDYVVVYDPSAGFVTGGGWINSLAGMYLPDPSLAGKANFGFVSKYQKGATVPTGNTEFQFHAAGLNFSSTNYEWLVVSGSNKATYKGSGTINGGGNYGFLLSASDASTGDKFRIKIWDKTTSTTVYDNQVGATDDAAPTTVIAGGSIVVHTSSNMASK